jgi:hypothetical protein
MGNHKSNEKAEPEMFHAQAQIWFTILDELILASSAPA